VTAPETVAASAVERMTTRRAWGSSVALAATVLLFAVLFFRPFLTLLDDWWSNPEAGHGLLLAPVAVWLAWRTRGGVEIEPAPRLGLAIIAAAIVLRYASGLAAELFTMRGSMLLALVGLVVYYAGFRRVLAWWLPFVILGLSVPLPEVLVNSIAMPLQLKASAMGATLLESRHVPVRLEGNVIYLPGHRLFVTEACSGLRSLTALLSLGVLAGGLWLRTPLARIGLLALAIPVAVLLNGLRVFLTGFLVYYASPALGEGFFHMTEGWLLFIVAFGLLGLAAWALTLVEKRWARPS